MNSGTDDNTRLLLPISAGREGARALIRHAAEMQLRAPGVEAVLLHVAPPITQWEVLRFRTQQEVAEFQAARARIFLDEAAADLAAAGVPSRSVFRHGDVVFTILDVAEEMQCTEILLPEERGALRRLLPGGVTRRVLNRQRKVPVRQVRGA